MSLVPLSLTAGLMPSLTASAESLIRSEISRSQKRSRSSRNMTVRLMRQRWIALSGPPMPPRPAVLRQAAAQPFDAKGHTSRPYMLYGARCKMAVK